ncbi:MAG TPA: sigma-70 family RNA polymerase sigma factor [Puia sp.]
MHTLHSDLQLANALCEGNTDAFRVLYNRHAESLLHLAFSRLNSLPDAEDCVQEVFCNFWQHCLERSTPFQEINLEAYLVTSVKNFTLRFYQKQLKSRLIQEQMLQTTSPTDQSTEEYISQQDILHLLKEELEEMPQQMRKVFELSRRENLSIREIASHLDLSEQTVKNHMSKALRRLRLRLGPQLLSLFL